MSPEEDFAGDEAFDDSGFFSLEGSTTLTSPSGGPKVIRVVESRNKADKVGECSKEILKEAAVAETAAASSSSSSTTSSATALKGAYRWDDEDDDSNLKKYFDSRKNEEKVTLKLSCPLGGDRLNRPVTGPACDHLEAFDRDNLFVYRNVFLGDVKRACPICEKPLRGGSAGVGVDETDEGGYRLKSVAFLEDVLSKTTAECATFYRDGSWDVLQEEEEEDDDDDVQIIGECMVGETIVPDGNVGPKLIQIYGDDGVKKTVKVENEDEMSRIVREKWALDEFPRQDVNLTASNFRTRRLKKEGGILVGRSLLERNEFPLYRSAQTEEDTRRRGRKRKRTVEERLAEEVDVIDRCVGGVLERQSERLEEEYEASLRQWDASAEMEKGRLLAQQRNEVMGLDFQLRSERMPREFMFRVGADLRQKHDYQKKTHVDHYERGKSTLKTKYEEKKRRLATVVRRDVESTARKGVPAAMREKIAKHGNADVDELFPAVLCGGNEKIIKTTYLPLDILKAVWLENDAYGEVYGYDDKVRKL